jgi:phosphomannomutase
MVKIYIFDIDGTLTPPRQPIADDFAEFFFKFCKNNIVYICTGSDWPKVKEQIPESILRLVYGTFTCSGNAFWGGRKRYGKESLNHRTDFNPPDNLIEDLKAFVDNSAFPIKMGRHIDIRTGMLNFSIAGRNCTLKQRGVYIEWDKKHQERKEIVEILDKKYKDLSFNIGGQISIDIYPDGLDKSRSVRLIRSWHKKDVIIHFFGDKIHPGGNDYAVLKELMENDLCNNVVDYEHTMMLLSK